MSMLPVVPQVILAVTLALTLTKTVLVADALWEVKGGQGIASRVSARSFSSLGTLTLGGAATAAPTATATATATAIAGARKKTPPSNVSRKSSSSSSLLQTGGGTRIVYNRSLHGRLLVMHVFASLAQIAALLKYTVPASDVSCLVTHRLMMGFLLFYDAYLVLFLLAKTDVTNDRGTLPCWQKAVRRWSVFWARVYLPVTAVYYGLTFPGGANDEGETCFNGIEDNTEDHRAQQMANVVEYAVNSGMLMIEFVLLLALFVRPILRSQTGCLTSDHAYRRIVKRNVTCTVIMLVAYAIGTAAVVFAMLHLSSTDQVTVFYADLTPLIQSLITLGATEVALPLGVVSFYRSFTGGGQPRTGSSTATKWTSGGGSGIVNVVPKRTHNSAAVVAIVESV